MPNDDEPQNVESESVAQVEQPDAVMSPSAAAAEDGPNSEQSIESPAKIIRVGAMVKQLLEEVRHAPIDESARDHLRDIYEQSIEELKSALSPAGLKVCSTVFRPH